MNANRLPAGHGWAYFGVALGLTASVAGNIASTVLTESAVTLWLRVPLASLWTIFLGVGIEVLTRINWTRGWKHWGARLVLIGPMSLVAGIVSYLHLHHLMTMTGEPGLAQAIGPLAVDGTLFGCTVALLVTRHASREDAPKLTLAQRVAAARTTVLDVKAAAAGEVQAPEEVPAIEAPAEVPVPAEVLEDPAEDTTEVPVLPAPVSPAPRTRAGSVDYAKVTRLVLDNPKDQDVADLIGSSPKTPQRVRRAIRLMDTTQDLAAIASTVKLSLAAVTTIQKELTAR